jgi:ribosomal protein S18 acetylase RimI-like enzyme
VYTFRPFLNSDPPRLVEIWRNQPPQRGLMQPITTGLFEQMVLAKQHFDPAGLIVALAEEQPVGFVHAGFGPSDDERSLSTELGTTQLLILNAEHRQPELADALLQVAERYLRGRGATVIYAGGIRPLNGFYLGLYGGSELPGVLVSDAAFSQACRRGNYREIDRVVIWQRELTSFRAPVTRTQRQLRREFSIREEVSPPAENWWSAMTIGAFDRLRFSLAGSAGGDALAEVWFWDIEPLSTGWGIATAGLVDLHVATARRRQGLATFLLSEAFAKLANRGVLRVEAQTMQTNEAALALYKNLGFEKVDEGVVFRKQA